MDIEESLDGLTKKGILQKGNRMAIEALLNPEHELHVINDATEEEICCAVLNAQEVLNNASLMPSATRDELNDEGVKIASDRDAHGSEHQSDSLGQND